MPDNVAITAGSGTNIATDDVSGVHYQKIKLYGSTDGTETPLSVAEDAAHASGDHGIVAMTVRQDTPSALGDTSGDYQPLITSSTGNLWTSPLGFPVTVQTDVTRPNDAVAYAALDALSDSTSAPTTGGFTFSNIARKSGGSVLITDATVASSADPATRISGEIFLFNQAVTNINDNAAFVVSDTEIKTCVGVIPFFLFDAGNNGYCHITGLNFIATCVGSANLRFLVRVRNAYTPTALEVLTFTLKGIQLD